MSDIAILKEMIRDLSTVTLVPSQTRNKVILTEPQPPNYSVTIDGMPDEENVIVIKADDFKSPSTIFRGDHGECRRADFVIIADTGKKKVILCIEMKAGQSGRAYDILQQLEGARCFAEYCKEIGKSFWKQPEFLTDYEYRFVSIKNIGIKKQRSIIESSSNAVSKTPFSIKNGLRFQFNDLIQCRK
jgi:hypothetical protein